MTSNEQIDAADAAAREQAFQTADGYAFRLRALAIQLGAAADELRSLTGATVTNPEDHEPTRPQALVAQRLLSQYGYELNHIEMILHGHAGLWEQLGASFEEG